MIIGINGFKDAGKDTAGKYLVDTYGFQRIAFADKMKQALANIWELDWNTDLEWRKAHNNMFVTIGELLGTDEYTEDNFTVTLRRGLQNFGNLCRKTFGEDFWVREALYGIDTTKQDIVVTDARYENELEYIKNVGGYNIQIRRPYEKSDGHASEQRPRNNLIDATVFNDEGIDVLNSRIDLCYKRFKNLEEQKLRHRMPTPHWGTEDYDT